MLLKPNAALRLMDNILHDPKDPKLWELWYIPYYGSCRIMSINRINPYPDPREDLESRSPSLGPYTTKGAL